MTTTDIALPSEKVASESQTVATYIETLKPEIGRALPRGMDADRIARLAMTVIRTSDIEARKSGKPENSLVHCSPQSFAGALLTASALGLEPGVNGEAYLVPYKRECQLIVGYQGYTKLFWQSPLARHIDAQPVYEHDEFDYAYGTKPFLTHKPAAGDRGALIYYYGVATLSTGGSSFVVLTPDEVKRLRSGKEGPSGNIKDPMRWMERKTVLRQLVKTLPKSTMLNAALAVDEEMGSTLRTRRVAEGLVDTRTGELDDGAIEGEVVE
jgi:recombination protein RecT